MLNMNESATGVEKVLLKWSLDEESGGLKEDGPPGLPTLDPEDEIISEYISTCPVCGEEYRERRYIKAESHLFISERGSCSCLPEKGESSEERLQRSKRRINRCLGESNLANSSGAELEDFVSRDGQDEALELARLFLRSDTVGKSFLLTGPPGRGKSELALALARSAARNRSVIAIKSIELLDRIRRSLWEENNKNELLLLLREVDLLVIDDIGVEKITDWVLATLYSIIDYRFGRKDTVYTSNLTGKQMSSRLGEALTSRICGSKEVTVSGKDWRIEDRQRNTAGWDREGDW